jgi:hypothetical protein
MRRDDHRGSMFDVFSALHQIDIPCTKGEIIQQQQDRGRSPKRRMALFH